MVSNRWFLEKKIRAIRNVLSLVYITKGETGMLWERRGIIFNIKRNMLYIISWDCVSNSIAGKATAFRIFSAYLIENYCKYTRRTFIFFFFEFITIRKDDVRFDKYRIMILKLNRLTYFIKVDSLNGFF